MRQNFLFGSLLKSYLVNRYENEGKLEEHCRKKIIILKKWYQERIDSKRKLRSNNIDNVRGQLSYSLVDSVFNNTLPAEMRSSQYLMKEFND